MGAPQYEQAGADIGGSGTTNTIPRWTGPSTLGDSVITQNTAANAVGVGATVNSTWAAGWRAVQIGQNAAIWAETSAIDGRFSQNVVWTGSAFNYLVNGAALMYAQNANGHTWSYAGAGTAGNPITFTTGMVLNSSGNVGIGTSGPQVRAHVYAANVAGKGQIMVDSPAGDISQITFYNAGTTANGALYANTSGMVLGTSSSGSLSFQQNGGTAWQIIAGRHLVAGADNTYDIGASGATRPRTVYVGTSFDASASGAGLKLPATPGNTDPNTLDCYADGGTANSGGVTWTPTLTFGGATTGVTYQTQVGRYTRVGNMVFATCYFVLTSKGTATGNVKITGLPTSSNTTSLFTGATVGYFANITSTGQVMGYMSPNDTGIILNQTTAVGANTALTDANFANNSAIIVTIAYPVT